LARTSPSTNASFTCLHCELPVTAERWSSGVNNRNHCPYCLWSRHVDLNEAGDRLSACKAEMQPIGLTIKQVKKKYARPDSGELMLVHLCSDCGKVSINRIAADDVPERVMEVFDASLKMPPDLRQKLESEGIRVLGESDRKIVREQLYGRGS
jgi:hypothetical protein